MGPATSSRLRSRSANRQPQPGRFQRDWPVVARNRSADFEPWTRVAARAARGRAGPCHGAPFSRPHEHRCGRIRQQLRLRGENGRMLEGNRFEGYLIAAGGTTRPDAVHDARTHRRVARESLSPHRSRPSRMARDGRQHVPSRAGRPGQGAAGNLLHLVSEDDRIEGFRVGIQAAAARRLGVGSEPLW